MTKKIKWTEEQMERLSTVLDNLNTLAAEPIIAPFVKYKCGCIGFHPTSIDEDGRAGAWIFYHCDEELTDDPLALRHRPVPMPYEPLSFADGEEFMRRISGLMSAGYDLFEMKRILRRESK